VDYANSAIGEEKKKGTMGSPYAIRDYVSVNPDFGTLNDFKNLVKKVHELGMYIILDWVANHTAWDHTWIKTHPEFYVKNEAGKIISPRNTDWFDVADLNFDNPALRNEMIEALKYWITEADIDGYRCDMAGLVPTDFWETARVELDKVKPVFMLAEAEQADLLQKAFDSTYNWAVHHIMNDIAQGQKTVWDLNECLKYDIQIYSPNAIRMYFTSNHDENKNAGSAIERLGAAYKAFALLTYIIPGMPLIFSGQEAGLDRRLNFFDKDLIDWENGVEEFSSFYLHLNKLRKENKALWCGYEGGEMVRVNTNKNDKIYAVTRKKETNRVLAVFNLSSEYQDFIIHDVDDFEGERCYFTQDVFKSMRMSLHPWGYKVFVSNK
jgi:glycosidase